MSDLIRCALGLLFFAVLALLFWCLFGWVRGISGAHDRGEATLGCVFSWVFGAGFVLCFLIAFGVSCLGAYLALVAIGKA